MTEQTHFHADIKAILVQEGQQGQHKAQYGTRLMERLSSALTTDFGRGFPYANLYNLRQFYRVFLDQQIPYTRCRELSRKHLIGGLENEPLSAKSDNNTP
ncbi:DUF1016 N-terminal domain-containing protein [Pseudomonas syringae]|uniref:DUF1016 N-terminal domain-containing protein n=1 Tax=Pseudomonas syringae TaxID=317 RepID=UPI003F769513